MLNQVLVALENRFPSVHDYGEQRQLVFLLKSAMDSKDARILDVGCGFGKNMRAMIDAGFTNVTGVDVNAKTIESNVRDNLRCVHADALDCGSFDALIMSHVIEHFQPENLMVFIDGYLDMLRSGGVLLVSTPLVWEGFYQDFDHIKPYYPKGLLSVFGQQREQVQYFSRNRLVLIDGPWVRRMPWLIGGYKYFLMQPFTVFERVVQVVLNVAFYASKGRFGRPNGWMAIFMKS